MRSLSRCASAAFFPAQARIAHDHGRPNHMPLTRCLRHAIFCATSVELVAQTPPEIGQ
jgi:hypothetical protein